MRKLRILAAAASLAIVVGGLAAPGAHAAGVGGVAFEGTASLPQFPCSGPCAGGTFSGKASGSASGVDGTTPWSVTFANSSMTADFSYDEPAATCPAQGTASGTFDISGGTGRGTWGTEVSSNVSASGTFTWTRVGATAVIHTEVDIWIGTHHTHVKDDATAAFATNGVPNCANPGPITATVAGVDIIDG